MHTLLALLLSLHALAAPLEDQLSPVGPTDVEQGELSDPLEEEAGPPEDGALIEGLPEELLPPPAYTLDPSTEAALSEVGALFQRGLDGAARDAALELVTSEDHRVRAAAWMALGVIERERGDLPGAMRALDEARQIPGPLAEIATWTLADLASGAAGRNGSDLRAIEVCEAYRAAWPRGRHAADCLAVLALAHARLGRAEDAHNAAEAWRAQVRRESIREQVDLALVEQAIQATHAMHGDVVPPEVVVTLRALSTRFTSPQVGLTAARWLDRLGDAGVPEAAAPLTLAELQDRAVSLRNAGLVDAAWDAWLVVRRSGDPAAQAWLDREATTFGWSTRQWDALEVLYRERYNRAPSSEIAWDAWRAASRGGRYDAARGWLHEAQARWRGAGRWSSSAEMVGRTLLIGGDYAEAATWFERIAGARGATARRNLFLVGFSQLLEARRGPPPAVPTEPTPPAAPLDPSAPVPAPLPVVDPFAEALAVFDQLISTGGDYTVEARYWRAQLMAPYDPGLAEADRSWIHTHAHDSWHALLLRQPGFGAQRDGRLPSSPSPLSWMAVPVDPLLSSRAPQRAISLFGGRGSATGTGLLSGLRWGLALPDEGPLLPESGYPAGPFHDPEAARERLFTYAEAWSSRWPELSTAVDLARVGLHDQSGPLLAALYDEIRGAAWRGDRAARSAAAGLTPEARLPLFLFARDHHHTARDTVGLQVGLHDPDARLATERLQMPLAFARPVWRNAQKAGLDPMLVLSIMRSESTYNPNAVSRAGARGPMQILPRTGHLLASLTGPEGDSAFTVRSLHDPVVAVTYGIRYLGLLSDRFEGVVPLAVAAYNAGPHNVAAWMEGMGPGTPLDVFAEAIPFVETRAYVRKVMLAYDRYVTLHGPPDARVVLPPAVAGNHPGIVDF
jgi:soluble lytic murein transglycosylase